MTGAAPNGLAAVGDPVSGNWQVMGGNVAAPTQVTGSFSGAATEIK
jgi:hypothetical protein